MDRYTILKRTTTHADVLAAVGAADLLRDLSPRLVNFDNRFEVQLDRTLRRSDLDWIDPGFSYLARTAGEVPCLPPERIVYRRAATSAEESISDVSATNNRMYLILGRMNAQSGPNKVVLQFAKEAREKWTRGVWDALHGSTGFMRALPLVQLFNPHSCRGYALMKPSGTDRRNRTKDRWAEPFIEWLRYRGYFEGSAGWFVSGDLRLYCPIPGNVSYSQFAAVVSAFRELRLGGSGAKVDCRAVLELTRLLIESSDGFCPPRNLLAGVSVTHYKDMGRVHTFMGMDQLAIPDWFDLRTPGQAQLWRDTLAEHDTVVRRLTDRHSDELSLLKQYRRTFQIRHEDAIAELLEFLGSYAMFLFRRRALDHWLLPQFSISSVAPILSRDRALQAMIWSAGFLAVASAIRGATFGAQSARRGGNLNHRETRYGLFAELRRSAQAGKEEFLRAASSFLYEFNQEALNRRRSGIRARQIEQSEVAEFAAHVEQSPGSQIAANLLCGIAACLPGVPVARETDIEAVEALPHDPIFFPVG